MKLNKSLILLLATLGCGPKLDKNSQIKNVPGEDSEMGVLPGQGLNHIDWTPQGHCVELGQFQTQSGQSTGTNVEFRMLEITSLSSLYSSLNISASASIKSGLFGTGGSASMNYAKSINKNSNSRYLLVHTRVGNQLKIADRFTFTDSAQRLLEAGRVKDFTKSCGTEFVYGYRTGGEFFALFEYEFSENKEEERFSAAIKASGTGWKASTNINQELSRYNMNARVSLTMLRKGGTGDLPEVNNLTEYARKFPTLVDHVSNDAVTLELLTKNFGGVEPIDLAINTAVLVRQERIINQIYNSVNKAEESKNTVQYIQENPSLYETFNSNELEETENKLSNFINVNYDAAVNCFEDIFDSCKLPEVPYPSVRLPKRIYLDQCRYEMVLVCTVPSENGCLAFENRREQICE